MITTKSSLNLKRDSVTPLYKQVESWLRQQIDSGAYSPGMLIPSTKELCRQMGGINHLTVRQAISELTKSGLLRSIQGKGTFVAGVKVRLWKVALVLPNMEDQLPLAIAQGVQDVFSGTLYCEKGVEKSINRIRATISLFDSRRNNVRQSENIGHLEDMSLDGAIIFPVTTGKTTDYLVKLKADAFPVVLVDSLIPGLNFFSVVVDNYKGAYEATSYLLKNKKRRIAWIGSKDGHSTALERFEGFRDAINDAGFPYDKNLCFDIALELPSHEEELKKIIEKILALPSLPEALVCDNDIHAMMCIRLLQQRGLNIPENMAVVGFDDVKEAESFSPALTTVRQPMREMGRKAAELMLDLLENPKMAPLSIRLPVSLSIRESA
jgi:DNA-binding LacI/PurR family transcriptional regulator